MEGEEVGDLDEGLLLTVIRRGASSSEGGGAKWECTETRRGTRGTRGLEHLQVPLRGLYSRQWERSGKRGGLHKVGGHLIPEPMGAQTFQTLRNRFQPLSVRVSAHCLSFCVE